ncbi:hypothetical protein [Kocuria sabuli]|uniref:hypothetical protein n=1 Tax=Kocuria sabuli TaxID=3071448 RepID=UPI0034D7A737
MNTRSWSDSDLENANNFPEQHELVEEGTGKVLDRHDPRGGVVRLKKDVHDMLSGPRVRLTCAIPGHGFITEFVRRPGVLVRSNSDPVELMTGHAGHTWESWDVHPVMQRGPASENRDDSVDYWDREHEHFTIDIACPYCHPQPARGRRRGRNFGMQAPKFSEVLDLVWFAQPRRDGEVLSLSVQVLEQVATRHFQSADE